MSKTLIGDAVAYCKPPGMEKALYVKMGTAFLDDDGRMSLKIDALPLPSASWTGWVNIFDRKKGAAPASLSPGPGKPPVEVPDDDIPF